MSDLISRQAAIDVLDGYIRMYSSIKPGLVYIKKIINKLPSAEPQIIRCKDCDRRDEYGCCKYWKLFTTGVIPVAVDDDEFCNHARRRTDG